MAAYASAVSLMHIIDLIKNHPSPPISLDKEQFHSLTEVVTFLQEFLEGYVSPFSYSDEADPLEMRIAEAVYAAEDVIESYIVDNIHLATAAATTTTQDDDVEDYCDHHFDNYNGGNDDNDADNDHGDNDDGGDGEDHGEDRHGDNDDGNGNGGNNDDDDDDKDEIGDNHHNDDDGEEMESYKVDNKHLAAGTTHDDEVMESYIVDNIQLAAAAAHEEDEQIRYINFYHGLQKVIEAMDVIKKDTMVPEKKRAGVEAEMQRNVLADSGFKSNSIESKKEMVGFEDELLQLKERLVGGDSNRQIIPIVGMGGIDFLKALVSTWI